MTSPGKRGSHALILRPPPPVLAEIAALQRRVGGTAVPAAALGLTIGWLGYEDAGSAARIARVREALDGFVAPSRRVLLDQLVATPCALLLRPAELPTGVVALHESVAAALAVGGVRFAGGWRFAPQLTLARGRGLTSAPVDPIAWTADAVELVRNHPGHRVREPLGRWNLRGGATA